MSAFQHEIAATHDLLPMAETAVTRCSEAEPCAPLTEHRVSFELEVSVPKEVRYKVIHSSKPVFSETEPALATAVGTRPVLLVVDELVHQLYGEDIGAYSRRFLNVQGLVLVDGTERNKTWRQVEMILEAAINCHLSRDAVLIAVGGGVTLDMSGLAASVYRRGIAYLRVPTTLVGLVDVSVGIKQAINFGANKSILGSFYPPMLSINDVTFLRTLPGSHLAAGVAEILKMAIIADERLFCLLEMHGPLAVANRFQQSCALCQEILERAEISMVRELKKNLFESDLRRLVDFGHTFSPAIEVASDYELPHGYAVGLDILISAHIAVSRSLCPPDLLARLLPMYRAFALPIRQDWCTPAQLHHSLRSVKAHRGGNLNLVLPTRIGEATFVGDVTEGELVDALSFFAREDRTHASPCL